MPRNELDPIVGNWYRHLDKGYEFTVVAVDDQRRTIEIQHYNGDIAELDDNTWRRMAIELMEPPEDWTGPYDDIERDELGYSETGMHGEDWSEHLGEYPGRGRR